MKIAVYTLTRDRLAFTKMAFESLRKKAGYEFDHFVIDNGSEDGSAEWLEGEIREKRIRSLTLNRFNAGISHGSNQALDLILAPLAEYNLIVKFDNDCVVQSANVLGQMIEIYESLGSFGPTYILSPAVQGINRQPARGRFTQLAGRRVGIVGIVGGLFRCVPRHVYAGYRYPESLPKAKGQDDHFCDWARKNGAELGYVEGLTVEHYLSTDGQAKEYPAYFERKWQEEKFVEPVRKDTPEPMCKTCETLGIANCPEHVPF